MIRNSCPHGLFLGINHNPWYRLVALHNKGKRSGGKPVYQLKRRIIYDYQLSQLLKIVANQGEVVRFRQLADSLNPFQPRFISQFASESISRIGRIGDYASISNNVSSFSD